MGPAEYLEWEREQLDRHEYHRGEIVRLLSGSFRHSLLTAAVCAVLGNAVRGRGCAAFDCGMRIAAAPREVYTYADAVAVCGGAQLEPGTDDVLANPSVIVEVLSPSTEGYDRGAKWEAYQRLASLTDYLLVAQASVRVEHNQRESGGSWRYRVLEAGDTVTLTNGATLSVDAVYEGAFEQSGG